MIQLHYCELVHNEDASLADEYSMFAQRPVGVVVADASGSVRVANTRAAELLGLSQPPLGGQLSEIMALRDERDCPWFATLQPYLGPEMRTGFPRARWLNTAGETLVVGGQLTRSAQRDIEFVAISLTRDDSDGTRGRGEGSASTRDALAALAHELRSPAAGIHSFATSLLDRRDRLTEEDQVQLLETIVAESSRQLALITDYVEGEKSRSAQFRLRARPVNATSAIADLLQDVAFSDSVEVSPVVSDVVIWADPMKLGQVLRNVMENALMHGSAPVEVMVSVADPATAVIDVRDQGPGFAPEISTSGFAPYVSGSSHGWGLGLHLARSISHAHGADIEIIPSDSGGGHVRLLWPRVA